MNAVSVAIGNVESVMHQLCDFGSENIMFACHVGHVTGTLWLIGHCNVLNDFVLFIVRVIYMCIVELACNCPVSYGRHGRCMCGDVFAQFGTLLSVFRNFVKCNV